MTIVDFKDWLKTEVDCPSWFTGGLRNSDEKAIVIYNGKAYTNPVALGGPKNSTYHGKGIRILVHWTNGVKDSEF